MSRDQGLDEIHLHSSSSSIQSSSSQPLLIYFIPGNPGLTEYYTTFLTDLFERLSDQENVSRRQAHVYAASLPGFEVSCAPPTTPHPPPFTLQETIALVQGRIEAVARRVKSEHGPLDSTAAIPVILMGHSVGTYMLLEILASLYRPSASRSFDVKAGICLFPTIVDLAQSPMGVRLGPFLRLPFLASTLQFIVRLLFSWMPLKGLSYIVGAVNGMPENAAMTTARFLQSRGGVRQGLYLARHEVAEMTQDKWGEEVWGAATNNSSDLQPSPSPRLFFYWGTNDHWIANETRDKVIATRGRVASSGGPASGANSANAPEEKRAWAPFMEIDDMGTPHDFCIRHSRPVAAKTTEYIEQIMREMEGNCL